MDYSKGRFNVFDSQGVLIGRIDHDEYVRSPLNQLLFRLDGDEAYDMTGELIGFVDAGRVMQAGQVKFRIEVE